MNKLLLKLAAAVALSLAFACGSDGDVAPAPLPGPVAVTGVELSQKTLQLTGGQVRGLTAQVLPSGAANKNVTWVTSDDGVASFTANGSSATVTAIAVGTATITVRTADGNLTDACTVIVTDGGVVHVAGITMDRPAMGLAPGTTDLLAAKLWPSNATDQDVSWASSNPAVVTVANAAAGTALVRALANGTATITATTNDGGFTASCAVTVAPYIVPVVSMVLDKATLSLFPDRRRALTATVLPINATNLDVNWISSDESIATVAGAGLVGMVTAVTPGAATITATTVSGGRTATCAVTVEDGDPVTVTVIPATMGGGYAYSLALKDDGSLWAWGDNEYGQLGVGDTENRNIPVQVGMDTSWVSVAAGRYHSAAVMDDGSLWAWGWNIIGQLGDGTFEDRWTPVQVGGDNDWKTVSVGEFYSVALKTDGSLWAWGDNEAGQLGVGDDERRYHPTQVGEDSDWKALAGGTYHVLAIKTDGSLWAWGDNFSGELGLGDDYVYISQYSPVQVGTDYEWASVAASWGFTLAIQNDGSLWAWGTNNDGQLGFYPAWPTPSAPLRVDAATDWAAVSAGIWHSVAIKDDGSLWSSGDNNYGQLGDGVDWRFTHTQVGEDNDWAAVSAGGVHTLVLKDNGSLWACGNNWYGQLGDGTGGDGISIQTVPVLVGTGFRVPAR